MVDSVRNGIRKTVALRKNKIMTNKRQKRKKKIKKKTRGRN